MTSLHMTSVGIRFEKCNGQEVVVVKIEDEGEGEGGTKSGECGER